MTDWREARLDDLCARITSGGTPSRKRTDYFCDPPDGHAWVKSQELVDRRITATSENISDAGLRNSSAKELPVGAILIAMYGANVGQLGYLGIDATVNQAICALIADPAVSDPRFLYYALAHSRHDLVMKAHGAAQQNLSQELIRPYRLLVPELDIQRRIGSVLQSIDDLIEKNRRRIQVLEEIARTIYREWFVDFRYPGYEDAVLVDSSLGAIPKHWQVGRIDSHFVLQRGFDLPASDRKPGPIPIIGASGRQGSHSIAKAAGPGLITGRSGTVGTVNYVPEDYWPLNTALWVKEFRLSTPRFAYFLLSSLDLAQAASGAAVPTLNRNVVHALPAICPPRIIIDEWDAAARPIFDSMERLRLQSQRLVEIRDLLLPRLRPPGVRR